MVAAHLVEAWLHWVKELEGDSSFIERDLLNR